jgi:hypothetical protein
MVSSLVYPKVEMSVYSMVVWTGTELVELKVYQL